MGWLGRYTTRTAVPRSASVERTGPSAIGPRPKSGIRGRNWAYRLSISGTLLIHGDTRYRAELGESSSNTRSECRQSANWRVLSFARDLMIRLDPLMRNPVVRLSKETYGSRGASPGRQVAEDEFDQPPISAPHDALYRREKQLKAHL